MPAWRNPPPPPVRIGLRLNPCSCEGSTLSQLEDPHCLVCSKIRNVSFGSDVSTSSIQEVLIEKWKKALDKGGSCAALLTDLPEAFDSLPRDLLIATLHAYGLDYQALKILSSYLHIESKRLE